MNTNFEIKKRNSSGVNTGIAIKRFLLYCLFYVLSITGCSHLQLEKAPSADSQSWQQYGGSSERTNVAKSMLTPPLTLAWTFDGSAGYSEYSVSVADGIMYAGNLQGDVQAVQMNTGEKIGAYDFSTPVFGAPVIDNSMMYVATSNTKESFYCYDLVQGRIVWRALIGGIETSPLLLGEKIIVTTLAGEVYCMNKRTGEILWKFLTPLFERSAFLHSSPASDGNVVVFGCDDGSVFCISAEDGKLLWRASTKKSVFSSPSIRNGKVFIGSQDACMYAFALADGKLLWKQALGSTIFTSQSVDEDRVYAGTSGGEVICLKSETGEILWKYKTESVISAPPLSSGNVLFAGSLDKTLYALDTQSGELLWKQPLQGRIKSMPVIWKEYLLIPLDNRTIVAMKQGGGGRE